jgi:PAS domain S-box-containing protein
MAADNKCVEPEMKETQPTYEELKKKLANAEKVIAGLQRVGVVAPETKRSIAEKKRDATIKERDSAKLDSSNQVAYTESEENFRNSLDACPLGVLVITSAAQLYYANQATLDIFGYKSIEELKAVPPEQLFTTESRVFHRERIAKLRKDEAVPSEYETTILRPDGEIRNLQVFSREIIWGGERQFMVMYQDITERLKLETAIQYHANLIENTPDAIVSGDKQYRIYSWNKGAERMYGWRVEEVIGKDMQDIINPGRLEFPYDEFVHQLRKNGYWSGEDIHQRKNGERFPVLMTTSVVRDRNNVELGAVMVAKDISGRKKIEEALKNREEFLNTVIENSPSPLWVSDANGTVIRINQALRDLLRVTDEEIVGKYNVFEDIQVIAQGFLLQVKSVYREGKTVSFTLNYQPGKLRPGKPASGAALVLEVVISPVKNIQGQVIHAICQQRDITARLKLESSVNLNTKLIQGISDAIISSNEKTLITRWNQAAEQMYGWREDEVIGKTVFNFTSPAFPNATPEEVFKEIKKNGSWNGEIIHHRKNGEEIYVLAAVSLLKDESGKEVGAVSVFKDITERKRMEAALVASEKRYRDALDNMIESCQIIDRNWRFTYINDASARLGHFNKQSLLGRTLTETFPGIEKTELYAAYEKCMQQHIPIRMEFETGPIDGYYAWLDVSIQPIPEGIFILSLNITEKKRADIAIHQSEEHFRGIFQSGPLGIVLSTLDLRFTMANPRYCEIFGYSEEELKTMTFKDISFSEDIDDELTKLEKLKRGEISYYSAEKRNKKKNSEVIWCSITVTAIRDNEGKLQSFLAMVQDITARKKDEDRINHLNLALRSIRNINQLITREKNRDRLIKGVCDNLVAGRSFHSAWIVLFDDKHQSVTWAGTNVAKPLIKLIEFLKKGEVPPCVQKALAQDKVIVTKDPLEQCTDCPVKGDTSGVGTMTVRLELEDTLYGVLCGSMWSSLLNDEDEISLFSEVAADITFALRDIALSSSNEMLKQEQLRAAKLESIGTLAGGIAHDFNNLLTGIMGNIGMAKSILTADSNVYEMLDEAEKAAVRSRDLTHQLLTFARGGRPIKKITNITGVIKDAATFALRGSKAKLELALPPDLWMVEADEGQLSQVIHNLVINAHEAMPQGGTLLITAKNMIIKNTGTLPLSGGNYIQIDVHDTGVGISPENLQKIFEPYFTTKHQGSGLGLTSAYSIVKGHGGSLLAESSLNQGSVFHVYLPASRKTAKGEKKVAVKKSIQAGGKILVMDDDETIRKMLKNMLKLAGYEVESSADGAEALVKYKQAMDTHDSFHAVIMDLTVPGGMGGKEAIVKLLEIDPAATVIVSSGYATDPIMSEYKKYGFSAVIAKPYSIKQLQEMLADLISGKKK